MDDIRWLSPQELVEALWFPLNSMHKVTQAIKDERLLARDFGNPNYSMYRIKEEWAIEFINNPQKNGKKMS